MGSDGSERAFGKHIVQYPADYSLCAGCGTCEAVCGLTHNGVTSPLIKRIFLLRDTTMTGDMHKVYGCLQCADYPCYKACPKKDEAMRIDADSGIAYVDPENCIGCGLCVDACPFEPKRVSLHPDKPNTAMKCDLCRERAEGPACVEYCQVRCIGVEA